MLIACQVSSVRFQPSAKAEFCSEEYFYCCNKYLCLFGKEVFHPVIC